MRTLLMILTHWTRALPKWGPSQTAAPAALLSANEAVPLRFRMGVFTGVRLFPTAKCKPVETVRTSRLFGQAKRTNSYFISAMWAQLTWPKIVTYFPETASGSVKSRYLELTKRRAGHQPIASHRRQHDGRPRKSGAACGTLAARRPAEAKDGSDCIFAYLRPTVYKSSKGG